jgi:hypothetical protein
MSSQPEPEPEPVTQTACVPATTLSPGRFMRCFNTTVSSSGTTTADEIAQNRNIYVNGQSNNDNKTAAAIYAMASKITGGGSRRICSRSISTIGMVPEASGIGRKMNQSG